MGTNVSEYEGWTTGQLLAKIEHEIDRHEIDTSPRVTSAGELHSTRKRPFLTSHDEVVFGKAAPLEAAAITAGRSGRAEDGDSALAALGAVFKEAALSPRAALFARSQLEAVASYLNYRRGEFADAIIRLRHAITDVNTLIDQHEMAHLGPRRVHLAVNWVRVLRRSDRVQEAIESSFSLLTYIEGQTSAWPFQSCLPLSAPPAGPLPIYSMLVDELIAEVAGAIDPPDRGREAFVAGMAMHDDSLFGRCQSFRGQHGWLRLKMLQLQAPVREFARQALIYLVQGAGEAPRCWKALIINLSEVSSDVPSVLSISEQATLRRIASRVSKTAFAGGL